ncbi:MAG: MFS transporter [Bacteroidetes bacterium]|nr:MFS transporter [Bacteroidota bacterium]MCL5024916.1 MFS transporter [Chloroflexota bacterium]
MTCEQEARQRLDLASLALCLLGNFLLRGAAAAAGTLISLHLASLQSSGARVPAQVVGLAAMFFYSAELVGSPAFGTLSDVKGRRPFMVLGPVLGGVAVQFILLAPTIPLVLLSRFLQGLSTASSVPSTLSYLSAETAHSEKLRGRVMSAFEVATIMGIASGFATGGILWDALHHSGFVAVIGIYVLSGLLLWSVRDKRVVGVGRRIVGQWTAVLRSTSALRLIPAWVSVNAIVGLWFSQLDFQMGKTDDPSQLLVGGFTGREIGLYTAGLAMLFVIGISLWAFAFGRLRSTQIMAIALAGLFALVLAMLLLNHSPEGDSARILTLVGLVCAAVLIVSGFTPAALVYLGGLAEECPGIRGSIMGLYSVFLGVGQFVGSGVGGFFAEWRGVDGMIILTAIFGAIAAMCVATLIRGENASGATVSFEAAPLPPGRP